MSCFEIFVPELPESVADATVALWRKKVGDVVQRDEIVVEIETDKVILEVPAAESGVITEILQAEGATVLPRQLLAVIDNNAIAACDNRSITPTTQYDDPIAHDDLSTPLLQGNDPIGPAARRKLKAHNLSATMVSTTHPEGRLTKQDILASLSSHAYNTMVDQQTFTNQGQRKQERVPMTRLRKKIAERLLETKNTTAMLTTFNEVNMAPVMQLRKQYGERFERDHGVRLGFMSFYVKAVLHALKHYPEVNASIDNEEIIYYHYFDISIAVSTPRGLVTPVLRDVNTLSMAEIEQEIKALADKGREGKLTIEALTGGNFTITNGGVFGSLLSTPLINPPQSAILGLHAIQDRPVAVNGEIIILPMMYLALSYDHRLIDGKEAVGFLKTVKETLEDPARLLLDI